MTTPEPTSSADVEGRDAARWAENHSRTAERCVARTAWGARCGMLAKRNIETCYWHTPQYSDAQAQVGFKAGVDRIGQLNAEVSRLQAALEHTRQIVGELTAERDGLIAEFGQFKSEQRTLRSLLYEQLDQAKLAAELMTGEARRLQARLDAADGPATDRVPLLDDDGRPLTRDEILAKALEINPSLGRAQSPSPENA